MGGGGAGDGDGIGGCLSILFNYLCDYVIATIYLIHVVSRLQNVMIVFT